MTLPMIMITNATRSLVGLSTPTSTPASTPKPTADAPYRLLYRGALSLPDSYLPLDGIAFSARLPNRPPSSPFPDSPSARELMYNPLALALESMRGRPSLRFKGTVHLEDLWTDDTGDVYLDVHPCATLTRIYFENTLCLAPLVAPPGETCGRKRTEVGVRVSLGDTDGHETTDIVIYGETASALLCPPPMQLSPATTSMSVGPPPLTMRVARITPAPRAPRPDDPTPRQPPARLFGGTTLGDLGASKRIVARPKDKDEASIEDHALRRAKEVMLHLPQSEKFANGHGKRKDKEGHARDAVFKVPELPAKARREPGTDVFGAVALPRPQSTHGKAKAKAEGGETGDGVEEANKRVLKKLSVLHLSNAGVSRSHHEFKDVFGFVYRGAMFALRSQLKTMYVSAHAAEAVVEAHVKLYVMTYGSQVKTSLTLMDVDDAGE